MDRFFDTDLAPADRRWVEGERRRLGEETNIRDREHRRLLTSQACSVARNTGRSLVSHACFTLSRIAAFPSSQHTVLVNVE